jgi:hypothetical protein
MPRLEVPPAVQQRAQRLADRLDGELEALHPSVGSTGDLHWLEADVPGLLHRIASGDAVLPEQTNFGTRAAGVLGNGPGVAGLLDVLFEVDRMVRGFRQSEGWRPREGDRFVRHATPGVAVIPPVPVARPRLRPRPTDPLRPRTAPS